MKTFNERAALAIFDAFALVAAYQKVKSDDTVSVQIHREPGDDMPILTYRIGDDTLIMRCYRTHHYDRGLSHEEANRIELMNIRLSEMLATI